MQFIKVNSAGEAVAPIVDRLSQLVDSRQKILLFLTGGSSLKICVEVFDKLAGQDLSNLTVTLSDERYVDPTNDQSNWQQLQVSGIKLGTAKKIPVLSGKNRLPTAQDFNQNLVQAFDEADTVVAFLGIGPDGHVAGILPGSPNIMSTDMGVTYADSEVAGDSPAGVLRGVDRITITPSAIARIDEAFVLVFGEAKHTALDNLEKTLELEQMPAQALKQVNNLIIYNDYKGNDI